MAYILKLAYRAGDEAVADYDREHGEQQSPYCCGYSRVVVQPGTSRFARWLKTEGIAEVNDCGARWLRGGVEFTASWGNDYVRSYEKAVAVAKSLRRYGIDAWGDSDMD